ncbi:MAG: prepilin-type N-terminal cleavage/methylation domain-containing protein [Proteobacteria bacterium]|nr:prepilin-type N-terminal cleavage/methylation domain-containing protein [Pseudomonadota bacterium]
MGRQSGFTLLELIISMVIMGIILVVGSMFFATMLSGYNTARQGVEYGQMAEIAVDRIVYELKNATGQAGGDTVAVVANTSVTYESTAPVLSGSTRIISYDGTTDTINLSVAGTSHLLLENVSAFTLGVTRNDLDGNAGNGNEISSFDVSFTITNYGAYSQTFTMQIAPREFLR